MSSGVSADDDDDDERDLAAGHPQKRHGGSIKKTSSSSSTEASSPSGDMDDDKSSGTVTPDYDDVIIRPPSPPSPPDVRPRPRGRHHEPPPPPPQVKCHVTAKPPRFAFRAPKLADLKISKDIHRVRSYSLTKKGLVNQGEHYISRSPSEMSMCSSTSADTNVSIMPLEPIKVLLLGASGVGKRALIQEFLDPDSMSMYFQSYGESLQPVLLCLRVRVRVCAHACVRSCVRMCVCVQFVLGGFLLSP